MRFTDADMKDVWVEYKKTGSKELKNRLIEKYMDRRVLRMDVQNLRRRSSRRAA